MQCMTLIISFAHEIIYDHSRSPIILKVAVLRFQSGFVITLQRTMSVFERLIYPFPYIDHEVCKRNDRNKIYERCKGEGF